MHKRTRMTWKARAAAVAAAVLAATGLSVPTWAVGPGPDTLAIDFFADGYTVGAASPGGQNGWVRKDNALDNSIVEIGGKRYLQFSNGRTNTSWGAISQLFTPQVAPAGELWTGATNNTFEASFTVQSETGGLQDRLATEIAIDNGTGSRIGGNVYILHSETGLVFASSGWDPARTGVYPDDEWRTIVSQEFDATVPHEVKIQLLFNEEAADQLKLYVDGAHVYTWYTFEEYHKAIASPATSFQANSLLIRTQRYQPTAAGEFVGYLPSADISPEIREAQRGHGYLFSDIVLKSYNTVPTAPPADLPEEPSDSPDETFERSTAEDGTISLSFGPGTFEPYENVYVTWYSTPIFAGWFQAAADGSLSVTLTVPDSFASGEVHNLQFTGQSSGTVLLGTVTIVLAETGTDADAMRIVGPAATILLAVGLFALTLARSRRMA